MKVKVLSRNFVKPYTPTPPHLRSYEISEMDELNEPIHVARVIYYPPDSVNGKKVDLKESLAQVLLMFYPLAGRYIKEKRQIDCNDKGAEYVEALVEGQLLPLIGQHQVKAEQLNHLLPLDIRATDEPTDPVLAVQINRFECGGVAIGVSASHRIFDSYSLGMFLTAWANATIGGETIIHPVFNSSSFFPSQNVPPVYSGFPRTGDMSGVVVKRFVFNKNAIINLRGNVGPNCHPPSRVAVVSAFLTQALIRADRAKHGKSRATIVTQAINVRERTIPPISKHACGTWVSGSCLECTPNESLIMESNFPAMVSKMRDTLLQGVKDCARIFSDKEFGRWVMIDVNHNITEKAGSPDYKTVYISDWSKFGEYELDFGFGKPVWVSLPVVPLQDVFILMNNKENNGIEAWVYLHETDMPYFEQDEDLKLLTSHCN